jgi:hypothetical protein
VIQLVDDRWLGKILRGDEPPAPRAAVFTTGHWYVRLCQAVLGASDRSGVLSASFTALPDDARQRAFRGLLELPDDIGLLSLRELGPVIGQLRTRHELNILAIEALAAAVTLEADVFLSASSPRLEAALRVEGGSVEVRP